MIPARFAPFLFGFLVSGMMSCLVSGFATWRALGFVEGFISRWGSAWMGSWAIAFPTILVVAPIVRRFVARITTDS